VAAGQTLVVAELVKTTHEVTAPAAGRLAAIEVAAGDTFGRHTVLARIEG
jgi:biotin carboxyl carrier protein